MTPHLLYITLPTGQRETTTVVALSATAALAAEGFTHGTRPDGAVAFVGVRTKKGIKAV